jgi:putative membrane protein
MHALSGLPNDAPSTMLRRSDQSVIASGMPQRDVEGSLVDWSQATRRHQAKRDLSASLRMTVLLSAALQHAQRAILLTTASLLVMLAWPLSASAHGTGTTGRASLWRSWPFEPITVVGLLLFAWIYLRGAAKIARYERGSSARRRIAYFLTGIAVLALALCTPLDPLSDQLLAAHMTQHMLLIMVAAPLLILGRPVPAMMLGLPRSWRRPIAGFGRRRGIAATMRLLALPLIASVIQAVVFWLWHLPPVYQAALRDPWLHALEHASFLTSALLFWWAVLPRPGMQPGMAALAIVLGGLQSGMLAALLTFSGAPWYPRYAGGETLWGISPLTDQQLAGLIMWIPGGMIALGATLGLVARWLQEEEQRADVPKTRVSRPVRVQMTEEIDVRPAH